jgi:hypothetical protein
MPVFYTKRITFTIWSQLSSEAIDGIFRSSIEISFTSRKEEIAEKGRMWVRMIRKGIKFQLSSRPEVILH